MITCLESHSCLSRKWSKPRSSWEMIEENSESNDRRNLVRRWSRFWLWSESQTGILLWNESLQILLLKNVNFRSTFSLKSKFSSFFSLKSKFSSLLLLPSKLMLKIRQTQTNLNYMINIVSIGKRIFLFELPL